MTVNRVRASKLFLERRDFVVGVALRYAPAPDLVDDIVQEAFLEFVGKVELWDLDRDLSPILYTLTKRHAKRFWNERLKKLPDKLVQIAEFLQKKAEEKLGPQRYESEKNVLKRCVDKLSRKKQLLLQLYYYELVPVPEIASLMEMKQATVHKNLSRLREQLRTLIKSELQKEGIFDV